MVKQRAVKCVILSETEETNDYEKSIFQIRTTFSGYNPSPPKISDRPLLYQTLAEMSLEW